jgi:hypothetical protein
MAKPTQLPFDMKQRAMPSYTWTNLWNSFWAQLMLNQHLGLVRALDSCLLDQGFSTSKASRRQLPL